jgi:hypothetical protein
MGKGHPNQNKNIIDLNMIDHRADSCSRADSDQTPPGDYAKDVADPLRDKSATSRDSNLTPIPYALHTPLLTVILRSRIFKDTGMYVS